MLVPNAVDPSGAGADVPLPRAKPAVVETAKPRKHSPIKAAAAAKAKQRASAPVKNKPKHKRKRKHRRRRWAGGG
jgi:hypothetical protein